MLPFLLLLSVASAAEPCLEPDDVFGDAVPYDDRLDSEHVSLRWNSLDAPPDPKGFVDAMEAARASFAEQGFLVPDGTLVVARTLPGGSTSGYTELLPCDDGQEAAIVVHAPRLDGAGTMRSLAAHELFHAVQAEYVESYEQVTDSWIVEASAVYASWQAFPDDVEEPLRHAEAWAERPYLDWNSPGLDYGMWVLWARMAEWAPDWPVDAWANGSVREDYPVLEHPRWPDVLERFLLDLPRLRLAELDLPRIEDHGGLADEGVVGDTLTLAREWRGAATARIDLTDAEEQIDFDSDGPLYLLWTDGDDVVDRSVWTSGPVPAFGDALYVTAFGTEDPSVSTSVWESVPDGYGEGCQCDGTALSGILLLPFVAIRRKIGPNQP